MARIVRENTEYKDNRYRYLLIAIILKEISLLHHRMRKTLENNCYNF